MLCFISWQNIRELLYLVLSFLLQRTLIYYYWIKEIIIEGQTFCWKRIKDAETIDLMKIYKCCALIKHLRE